MFKDVENLLNIKDDFTTAASTDDKGRTIKIVNSSKPLIVAPNKNSKIILECKWKSYM